jgi:hypothetical protein
MLLLLLLRDSLKSRDVNLIFSFFDVYAVTSKLIDQPVWNLAKNDVFTYWVFRSRFQSKKGKISTDIGVKRKPENEIIRFACCFRFDFIQPLLNPVQICQSIQYLWKNISESIKTAFLSRLVRYCKITKPKRNGWLIDSWHPYSREACWRFGWINLMS